MTDQDQVLDRKAREIRQGATIAGHALDVWGWATPAGQERARRRAGLLIRHGAIGLSATILELGCGTGLFSRYLGQTGARVVALDLSWDLLVQARQENDLNNLNITLVLADAEYLPFVSNAFDAVVGSSVLHHLQPEKALAEAHRVLRHGGNIAFAEPNMLNPQIALQKNVAAIKWRLGDSPDETAFFRWQAARLLKGAGFANVGVRPYDFLHPLTPRSLIAPIRKLGQCLESIPVVREIAGSLIMWGRKLVLS